MLDWQEFKIEDIAPQTAEQKKEWLDWLEQRRQSDIAARAEFDKILVGWNSPSGLIPYAKHHTS